MTGPFESDRWRRLDAHLDELLELEAGPRAARLAEIIAAEPELERDLRRLLEADARDRSPLDVEGGAWASLAGATEVELPERFGVWRPERILGSGGMGVVYLARRAEGSFEQRAAVKVLDRRDPTGVLARRFEQERRVLAPLEHPNIARLVDGGVTPAGVPWFAMEYVDGESITAWCEHRALDLNARLALFDAVCSAVAAAHRYLVVHRDLKPSNILVDAEGRAKLVDFGIAKVLAPDAIDATLTRADQRLLTPRYAAPEQVRGGEITTATDVYGLGAVLYELASGRPPFGEEDSTAREVELEVLSGRLRPLPSSVPADLAVIVAKALATEPERRYATVESLAEDLRRFRRHEPILARPASVGYRAGRFVRRHRGGVLATTLIALSLVAGLAATARQSRIAHREADRAQRVREFLVDIFEAGYESASAGRELTAREVLDAGVRELGGRLGDDATLRADLLRIVGGLYFSLNSMVVSDSLLALAHAAAQQGYGPHASETAEIAAAWAMTLTEIGHLERAEGLLQRALADQEENHGPVSREVATVLANLAAVAGRREQGELQRDLHQRVLDIDLQLLPPDHLEIGQDLNNLAVAHDGLGNYEIGDSLHRRALEIRRRHLGPDHPDVATSLVNLASVTRALGDPEAAEHYYREGLDIYRRAFPNGHADTADALTSLAILWSEEGRRAEVESVLVESVDILRRTSPGPSWTLARALNAWGTSAYYRGDLQAAADRLGQAAEVWAASFGPDNANALTTRNNRAVILHRVGRLEEAQLEFEAVFEIRQRILAPDNVQLGFSRKALGLVAVDRGRYEEAEEHLREALRLFHANGSLEEVAMNETLVGLGRCALARGDLELAQARLEEAWTALQILLPEGHGAREGCRRAMIELRRRQGRQEEAALLAEGRPVD